MFRCASLQVLICMSASVSLSIFFFSLLILLVGHNNDIPSSLFETRDGRRKQADMFRLLAFNESNLLPLLRDWILHDYSHLSITAAHLLIRHYR